MSEDLEHLSDQFRVEHQGPSPLRYHRGGQIERFGVVNPEAALPDEPVVQRWASAANVERDYWNQRVTVGRKVSGGKLAKPKTVRNPGAAAPGTVAFADVTPLNEGSAYINYIHTREDQRGQGHARRLVEHVAEQHAGILNFGKVMHPGIWKMKEELEQKGRTTLGHKDF